MSAAAPGDDDSAGDSANPFSSRMVLALLALGIVAFCLFLVLSAYAPGSSRDGRGGNNALSVSAVGFAGLVELLRSQEVPVAISRGAAGGAKHAFLILTPPPGDTPVPAARLADAATVLVVLPKWLATPDPEHPGWVERLELLASKPQAVLPVRADLSRRPDRAAAVLHGAGGRFAALPRLQLAPIDRLQTMRASADWTPILLDERGAVVLARRTRAGGPVTFVLTDPDLLDTQGLKEIAGARAALGLLDMLREGAPVTVDVTLNGFGRARNLLQLLFEPPLLGATLSAVAAALLMAMAALHRFGLPERRERVLDFGKRALADNAAGLIAMAGRDARMAVPYAQLLRALVIREIGAPSRLPPAAMDRFLDAAAAARGLPDTGTALASAAVAVTDKAALMNLARRLYRWSQGLRRERR